MIIGYARVSSKSQLKNNSFEQQTEEIRIRYAGIEVMQEQFTAATINRPVLDKIIAELKEGDTLVVTKLDRLARTTIEGIELVRGLFDRNINVHVLNIGFLENSMMGNFFLTCMLAVAELERCQIIERTQNGKEIARKNPDYKEGRPKKFSKKQIELALMLLETYSYTMVAEMTGISKSSLIRAKAQAG